MPQDPAVIQRQIEQTRAELAETVDAIAEIVSPKRVAERANEQVRAKVAELRQRFTPGAPGGGAPAALGAPAAGHRAIGGTPEDGLPGTVGSAPGAEGTAAGEGAPTQVVRTVRWDRVALVTAAVLLVAGVRRRRRRRR